MAKLSKEEFIAKIDSSSLSDEEKISFMEDISDSLGVVDNSELETIKSELEIKTKEYNDLVQKYKDRFMNPEEVKDEVIDEEEKIETEEDNVVDVTEIFEEKEEDK